MFDGISEHEGRKTELAKAIFYDYFFSTVSFYFISI